MAFRVNQITQMPAPIATGGATRLGLVRCEHCGRQFNPHSGARHIPWCAKQQNENKKHRLSLEKRLALERYKWRISYKPTNHFAQPPSKLASQQSTQSTPQSNNRCKSYGKSPASVNSSATLSSPSASSINSLGGGSSLSGGGPNTSTVLREGPRRRLPLKRSISSLTLTKQKGTLESAVSNKGGRINNDDLSSRAKSSNDLSRTADSMAEVVQNLARRMEEIYAQNRLLLAKMSSKSGHQSGSSQPTTDGSDCDSELSSMMLSCHHCRSTSLASANYCHKCGCKLHNRDAAVAPG